MSEPRTSRTTSAYLRNVVQQMRSRWNRRVLGEVSERIWIPVEHDRFPKVGDDNDHLALLFHDETNPEYPECVRAALRYMEAFYNTPSSSGDMEDVRRGFWALARLVDSVRCGGYNDETNVDKTRDTTSAETGRETVTSVNEVPAKTNLETRQQQPKRIRSFGMHDVFAAIEKNDIDKIMAIRDTQFDLLLGSSGAEDLRAHPHTPLGYAVSLGEKHQRVCVFLVGAFSRYVNHMPVERPLDEEELNTLRKVRANLKLAMDHSLYTGETTLVASYLQVLVMSEGLTWLEHAVKSVRCELDAWLSGKLHADGVVPQPLVVAHDAIESFLTSHMRVRRQEERVVVAAVDDYVANAASDLVLLALWSLLPGHDQLPLHAFARDERCTVLFCEQVKEHSVPAQKASRIAERIVDAWHDGLHTQSAAERWVILERIFRA